MTKRTLKEKKALNNQCATETREEGIAKKRIKTLLPIVYPFAEIPQT